MNVLDAAILLGIVFAAVGGYRLGFLTRVLSWTGLAAGLAIGVWLVPDLMIGLAGGSPATRFLGVTAFVLGLAFLGQALGLAIGALLHRALPTTPGAARADQTAGALVGGIGVVVIVWLLIPVLANAPGWPARAARDSTIIGAIQSVAPEPPAASRRLGRLVAEAPFPEVLGRLDQPPEAGPPPTAVLDTATSARVAQSVVKVEGRACDLIQDGTGFVVQPDVVVTNAHVVAGERRTTLLRPNGSTIDARVVAFDPERDLAILRAPGLGMPSLPLGQARPGDVGAVFGHPGGGPLRIAPARIAEDIRATGTDIYRNARTERDVFVLAAQLAPGDSGGPLVDTRGRVVGVAFAIDPGAETTAYALTDTELAPLVQRPGYNAVDTGDCLVG